MKAVTLAILAIDLLGAGCGGGPRPAPPAASLPQASASRTEAWTWIKDDIDGALARGKAEHKPVLVDGWALWCHTCLSMQSFVLTDPALAPLADRFIFVAIDTEKPENAGFNTRYPIDVYPTFFILDPEDGSIASRWLGSMSVNQVRDFLEEGERTVQLAHAGQIAPGDPLAHLRAGDKAALEHKDAEAAGYYAAALAAAPADWKRRPQAITGQLMALSRSGDVSRCVDVALASIDGAGNASNAADSIATGLGCAEALALQKADDPRVARMRKQGHDRLVAIAGDPAAPLSADDRSDIWRMVWDLREKAGDKAGAKDAARARLAVLEAAATHAPDAQAASTFDWARAETLLYLDRGNDAEAMLQHSEAGLPADYNPPARLARVYLELGRYADGLAAIDRAMAKAYGPRKTTILATKADLLEKMGRRAEARGAVEEQLAILKALPVRRPGAEKAAQKRIDSLKN